MGKEKAGNSKEAVTRGGGALRKAKEAGTRHKDKDVAPRSKESNSREVSTPALKSSVSKKASKPRQKKVAASMKSVKDKHEDNEELLNRMSKALTHNPWYHGLMPRDEIEDLLKEDGDFLVRKTEVAKHVRYAATVMYQNRIRHILFNFKNDVWSLRDLKRPTVTELIETHVNEKVPVMSDGTLLINAVPRPVFYILHEHIELKQRLGGGAFGDVYAANLKHKDETTVEVAVKRLKGMMHKKQRAEFVKEAKLMRRFDHPNIVKLYGVAPQEEPVMIVLELAPGGSLLQHLRKTPALTVETLSKYTRDAARGMCYLSNRHVIHRDIAARNCLMGAHDDLKISDFGLSVADKNLVTVDKLRSMPVKWLAPETLKKGVFSNKSDVWSFGILIWEIHSRCKTDPFPGDSNQDARKKILSGEPPMKAPEETPVLMANAMDLCFTQNPEERPDFEVLFKLVAPTEKPPVDESNRPQA